MDHSWYSKKKKHLYSRNMNGNISAYDFTRYIVPKDVGSYFKNAEVSSYEVSFCKSCNSLNFKIRNPTCTWKKLMVI